MSTPDNETRIIKCISNLLKGSRRTVPTLTPTTPVKQYLDSFNLIQLVSLLESEFGVTFEYIDLVESNWISPASIAEVIGKKITP